MSIKKETPGRSSDIIYDKEFSQQQDMIEEEDFYNDFAEGSPPKSAVAKKKTSHQVNDNQLNHMNEAQLKNFNSLN